MPKVFPSITSELQSYDYSRVYVISSIIYSNAFRGGYGLIKKGPRAKFYHY